MLLVDTSVWVDHLRKGDAALEEALLDGRVGTHPFVIGEIALGTLHDRETVLGALCDLPRATRASDDEVFTFIDRQALHGRGVGYVDAHPLASTLLTPETRLWTRDKRLAAVAVALGVSA